MIFRILALLLLVTSCSTINSVNKSSKHKKIVCLTNTTEKETYDWLIYFMKANKFEIVEQNEHLLTGAGKRGMSGWSWGEYLGFRIYKQPASIKISYKSAKFFKLNFTAPNWEPELKEEIYKRFKVVSCNN